MPHPKLLLIFILSLLTAAALAPIGAQEDAPGGTCDAALAQLWVDASSACISKPNGYICNGGAPPAAEPAGLVSNALAPLGALVDAGTVDALRTPPISPENNSLGIAWIRLPDPINLTGLLIGEVTMFDVSPPDFAPWTSSIVQTSTAPPTCGTAPHNVVVLQSSGQARIAINSVSLSISGTVLVATDDTSTVFVGLDGQATVLAVGQQQTLLPGEQISVPHPPGNVSVASAAPTVPIPLNANYLNNLPVALFDRPLILPQPGFASTQGAINLRAAPDVYSAAITQVPGGQILTILGRNADYTWFHVRLENGQTGWVLAELLSSNAGLISAVYSETPLPPQRLGELGTRGRVTAPAGVNLRRGPDATFPAIGLVNDGTLVDLLARSPYLNGWLKVNVSGTVGWLSLLTLDTQAYLDALPIDYNAPAMPTPTTIPGSFGNAFPDPENDGG